MNWAGIEPIESPRVLLEPLRIDHAGEMVHAASAAVARKQGLAPTDVVEDGEIRWQDG